jgi:Asp-tRNA(Asn)/Glu-tRNA(Gln) amidotransferase A subunit family amidase
MRHASWCPNGRCVDRGEGEPRRAVPPEVIEAFRVTVFGEGARQNEPLLRQRELLLPEAVEGIERGLQYRDDDLARAEAVAETWSGTVEEVLRRVELLALPTLAISPPTLEAARSAQVPSTPSRAASMVAMSIRRMVIIASITRLAAAGSG